LIRALLVDALCNLQVSLSGIVEQLGQISADRRSVVE
jgi:hypothetical protein